MRIGPIEIGAEHPPLVIAELSGNHNQSLERALELVEAAAESGVRAIKLQTYTPDTITLDSDKSGFIIADESSPWSGRNLYQLYKEAHTPWEWHKPIIDRASELGMLWFSSPFDETAVEFLEQLNAPAYKIASFENCDLELIKKVVSTGKPIILSTGMASLSELDQAVETVRSGGCDEFALLKCTSTYPANPRSSNVRTVSHLREMFKCEVGLSDHTLGIGAAIAAIACGATIIEKHLTLRRSDGGVDSSFSLEPDEMRSLIVEASFAWEALGEIFYGPTREEEKSAIFKRSLYIAEDIEEGDLFTSRNLRSIRPGLGLPPRYIEILIGRRAKSSFKAGTPVTWDLVL